MGRYRFCLSILFIGLGNNINTIVFHSTPTTSNSSSICPVFDHHKLTYLFPSHVFNKIKSYVVALDFEFISITNPRKKLILSLPELAKSQWRKVPFAFMSKRGSLKYVQLAEVNGQHVLIGQKPRVPPLFCAAFWNI